MDIAASLKKHGYSDPRDAIRAAWSRSGGFWHFEKDVRVFELRVPTLVAKAIWAEDDEPVFHLAQFRVEQALTTSGLVHRVVGSVPGIPGIEVVVDSRAA